MGNILNHEGVRSLGINQENTDALIEGAQRIDNARGNLGNDKFLESSPATMGILAMVIRLFVNLSTEVAAHMRNFECVIEVKVTDLHSQASDACDAA